MEGRNEVPVKDKYGEKGSVCVRERKGCYDKREEKRRRRRWTISAAYLFVSRVCGVAVVVIIVNSRHLHSQVSISPSTTIQHTHVSKRLFLPLRINRIFFPGKTSAALTK